jgi:hypothetical protein
VRIKQQDIENKVIVICKVGGRKQKGEAKIRIIAIGELSLSMLRMNKRYMNKERKAKANKKKENKINSEKAKDAYMYL